MARHSVGRLPQAESEAAIAAHLAGRLLHVGSNREKRDRWLADLGLKLRSNGLDRAASRAESSTRPWMLIDEGSLPLELEKAMVVFPGRGAQRPALRGRLARLGAVRQLLVTRSRRDLVCILVMRHADRDDVFETLERTGEPFLWEDVLHENRELEAEMWLELARRHAEGEELIV